MALANIAWILACNGKRVLAIDWDLEAPGLHRYFRPFLLDTELSSSEGLIDLIDRYATAAIAPVGDGKPPADWYLEYADFSDHVVGLNFDHFPPGGKVDLLPAGRQSDTYAVKVSSFNWQNFYDRLGGGAFIEAVKERARADYDYILIDSRTGVSDTAGICTAQLPDSLVVCFTYNNQGIKGGAAVARSALATHARLAEERATRSVAPPDSSGGASPVLDDTAPPYLIYPVPMRVDAGESDRLALRQAFARESFADLVPQIGAGEIAEYWSGVEVPHRVFYAYEEVLSAFKDDAHDPKTVLAAFLRLTAHITNREVTDFVLPIAPEVRREFLEAFAETPLTAQAKTALADAQRESAEEALVRNAEAALYSLGIEDKQAAQQVLCRLVRIGRAEEGGGAFPIRAALVEFDSLQRGIISQLARRGVLSVATESRRSDTAVPSTTLRRKSAQPVAGGEQSVAFADPRIVTLWPTLAHWLAVDREFLLWRQQLRTYLADWDRSARDSGALMSGTLLAEAQLWLRRRSDDLNDVERAYIEASTAVAPRTSLPPEEALSSVPVSSRRKFVMVAILALGVAAVLALQYFASTRPRTIVAGGFPASSPAVVDVRRVVVPNVMNYSSDVADAEIRAAGLAVQMVDADNGQEQKALAGIVVGQEPTFASEAPTGSVVRLKIATRVASVPSLTGLSLGDALGELRAVGLELGRVETVPLAEKRAGSVVSQDSPPGQRVPVGSSVAVRVATDVLAPLKGYKVEIFYYRGDAKNAALAKRIVDELQKIGFPNTRSKPSELREIADLAVPNGFEVRYDIGKEEPAAKALISVLRSAIPETRWVLRPAITKTPNYLSIFLPSDASPPALDLNEFKPEQDRFYVITGSHSAYDDARKQADRINAGGRFHAEVYAPYGGNPFYAVVVGANLPKVEADRRRLEALKAGVAKDPYVWPPAK
jgi:MinD-like ATPase involved in chromosome partitioning or flagellar assembly